jgi:hypothetical protein
MNVLSARNVRPNRLMGVEVTPTSHEIAVMDLAPEFGAAASVVINRDIAEFLIKELQAFLHPELRSAIERN